MGKFRKLIEEVFEKTIKIRNFSFNKWKEDNDKKYEIVKTNNIYNIYRKRNELIGTYDVKSMLLTSSDKESIDSI